MLRERLGEHFAEREIGENCAEREILECCAGREIGGILCSERNWGTLFL